MLSALMRILRIYAPAVTFPFAAFIGYIGYNIENSFVKIKNPPYHPSVLERREQRLEHDLNISFMLNDDNLKLKEKKFMPETIFEKNSVT